VNSLLNLPVDAFYFYIDSSFLSFLSDVTHFCFAQFNYDQSVYGFREYSKKHGFSHSEAKQGSSLQEIGVCLVKDGNTGSTCLKNALICVCPLLILLPPSSNMCPI
jgi:hypothetical protein